MRVGIVMPLAEQRGGAELMLMYLLQANLCGPRTEYHIAFLDEGPMVAEASALGYSVTSFAAGRLRQPHRYVQTVRALEMWIKRQQIDVVVSWMAKAHLYAGPAAYLSGRPAVWWQHGISNGHWLNRSATLLPAEAVFCCSKAAKLGQQNLSPLRSTEVIYPAIDLNRFNTSSLPPPEEVRSRLGLPSEGQLIGIVSRMQRWKGIHVFVEAAVRSMRHTPETHFVVVGGPHFSEPDYPTELSALALQAGIADRMHFVGYQSNVAEWMQSMAVLVHASIEPEPFGMVILEGMALGKPVVATAAGGPTEIITHGKDGLLVKPGDPGAMVSALDMLLQDDRLRRRLGESARQRAKEFSTDRLAREMALKIAEVVS